MSQGTLRALGAAAHVERQAEQTMSAGAMLRPGQHGSGICHCDRELQRSSRHCHAAADPLRQFGVAHSAGGGLSPPVRGAADSALGPEGLQPR